MNINSSLVAELKDKEYRDAYVGSQIRMTLPLQIRGLRESFEWTQSRLAKEAKMAQPRISELETPGERRLTLETLLRVASAFDVGLQVRFLPFSQLIDWNEELDLDNFSIPTFTQELQERSSRALRGTTRRRLRFTRGRRHRGTRTGRNISETARAQSPNVGINQLSLGWNSKPNVVPITAHQSANRSTIGNVSTVQPLRATGAGGYNGNR